MTADRLKAYKESNIVELLDLAKPILRNREQLYARYSRKQNPDHEIMHGDRNKQVIVAFEYYIVNMVQGYLGGKSPSYSIRRGNKTDEYVDGYTEAMEHIRRYNDDAATYIELLHDYLVTAAAYLYVYENQDNEIVYTRLDSRQTVGIYDYGTPANLIGLLRVWQQQDDQGEDVDVIELVTDEHRQKYVGDKAEDPEPLAWNDVPGVAFDNPDSIAVFEPAIAVIDAYEQIINNIRNMTQYNDNAKLLISGYRSQYEPGTPERGAEEQALYDALTLFVGDGGDIRWLLKNVDYSGMLDVLKSYHDKITMLTGVPNMTDEAFSNADNASALGYKLYALDQYSATTDRIFKRGYLRLWEVITNRLNLKGGKYDFRDIDIVMQRNIPTDKDKSLSRALSAYQGGLISQETAINESQLEVDAKDEIARIQTEQEDDYERTRKRNEGQKIDNSDDKTDNAESGDADE